MKIKRFLIFGLCPNNLRYLEFLFYLNVDYYTRHGKNKNALNDY